MGKKLRRAVIARTAFAIMLSLFSSRVFAYLDPSTGSMVVTALVGIFASLALALKTYWYKLRRLLRRFNRQSTGAGEDSPPGE